MIYTELTKKAMRICFEAHRGQTDKGGVPYVFHPFHVAEQMQTEEETCAALLHDVVEDTDLTLQMLAAEGFPPAVTDALALLTHDEGTPYLEYVARLKADPVAAAVKLADLRHNSTPGLQGSRGQGAGLRRPPQGHAGRHRDPDGRHGGSGEHVPAGGNSRGAGCESWDGNAGGAECVPASGGSGGFGRSGDWEKCGRSGRRRDCERRRASGWRGIPGKIRPPDPRPESGWNPAGDRTGGRLAAGASAYHPFRRDNLQNRRADSIDICMSEIDAVNTSSME